MASAYYAVKDPRKVNITVYDTHSEPGIGGASSAPVTLLHPFTPKGKLMWRGLEGFQAMLDIMKETNYIFSGNSESMRIIRPFYDEKRLNNYKMELMKHPQEVSNVIETAPLHFTSQHLHTSQTHYLQIQLIYCLNYCR